MGVERIEPSNYNQGLQRIRKMTCVVLVFHPQCGHCIEMRPKWEMTKRMANPRVKIVEVNGSAMHSHPGMSGSQIGLNTDGFPSLIRFHKGRMIEKYKDERSPEKMTEFVNRAVEPLNRNKRVATKAKSLRKKARGKTKKLRRKN